MFLGAAPSQILPRGGGMGQPGCPIPLRSGGVGQPGFPIPLLEGCALPHPPAGGGVGQPGCPIPLLEGCALPHPPAGGGVGQPGCPTPLAEGVCTRQAPCAWRTTPDATGPGARASRPRHGAAGTVTAPSLTFPPLGEGTRLLPPAGGGWEGGRTLRTMVTSAAHAAPPHTNRMKIGSSWEGCALPNPPAGEAGETRFPHAPLREPMFTLG